MKRYLALVPIDFSEASKCALAHAINLAKGFDGEVHLLNVSEEIPTSALSSLPVDFVDEVDVHGMDELDSFLSSFDIELPPLTKIVRSGFPSKSPADVILEYAQDLAVDAIVMGTHGRRGTRRLLLGSVTEEVVRRAVCPVLAVRQHKKACLVPSIERILVPIDFSDATQYVLEVAEEIALRTHASLILTHVVDIEFYPYYGLLEDPVWLIERDMIDVWMTKLSEMVAELRAKGLNANWETDTGYAARVVTEYADRNKMDLIVIGTHGRSGFDRIMVGSVAEKVLRSAPCPTIVVNTSTVPVAKKAEWLSKQHVA